MRKSRNALQSCLLRRATGLDSRRRHPAHHRLLSSEPGQVHAKLTHAFERVLINRALAHTGGRRIEAALALGIGRNTITRKIQELGLDGANTIEDREGSMQR